MNDSYGWYTYTETILMAW